MKISKKKLRKILESSMEELNLFKPFVNVWNEPDSDWDREEEEWYDDDYMIDGDEAQDEEVLNEVDYADDGFDVSHTFDDGTSFQGDIEDLNPEEAFSLGYKLSDDHPEIGVDGLHHDEYPDKSTSKDGRMFDYGSAKSDSQEGRMTRAKLFRMAQMAQSLESKLQDGDDLPGWVQDKVTTAEDRLRSAHDYMLYKIHRAKQKGPMTESKVRMIVSEFLLKIM